MSSVSVHRPPVEPLEAWRTVWRAGIGPQLSASALAALWQALLTDDPALIQGQTTQPPPVQSCQHEPVCGACLIGYAGWIGDGLRTVAEVEEFFANVCFEAGALLGEPSAARYLL